MNKTSKKLFSLLLALAMVLTTVSAVFAEPVAFGENNTTVNSFDEFSLSENPVEIYFESTTVGASSLADILKDNFSALSGVANKNIAITGGSYTRKTLEFNVMSLYLSLTKDATYLVEAKSGGSWSSVGNFIVRIKATPEITQTNLSYNYYKGKTVTAEDILTSVVLSSTPKLTSSNTTVTYHNGLMYVDLDYNLSVALTHKFGEKTSEDIRIEFEGSDTYVEKTWDYTITLSDMRTATEIVASGVPSVELGADYALILSNVVYVKVKDGAKIPGAKVTFDGLSDITTAGTYQITAKYAGDGDVYKSASTTFDLVVTDVPHYNVTVQKEGNGSGTVDAPSTVRIVDNVAGGFTATATPAAGSGSYTASMVLKKNDETLASSENSDTLTVPSGLNISDGDSCTIIVTFKLASVSIKDGSIIAGLSGDALKNAILAVVYDEIKPEGQAANVTVEYSAGTLFDVWKPLDFVPSTLEVTLHAFGNKLGDSEKIRVSYEYNGKTFSDTATVTISDNRLAPEPKFVDEPVYNFYEGKTASEKDLLSALIDSADAGVPNLVSEYDNGTVTVEYNAGSVLDIWKSLDFVPSALEATLHAFGNDTEEVRVTFAGNTDYAPGQWKREVSLEDLRIATAMSFSKDRLITAYGKDLRDEVAPLVKISIDGLDPLIVLFENDELSVDPEVLNAAPLTAQNLTVKYSGNDTYKSCEAVIPAYVLKGQSDLDIKSITVKYGEEFEIPVTSKPENLDNIRVIVGIQGDASGFVSIDIPESVKEKMKVKSPLTGETLFDIYAYIEEKVADGITLESLKSVLIDINETLNKKDPLTGKTYGELLNFDMESFNKIVETIKAIPSFDFKTHLLLGKKPVNAGLYTVIAVSTDRNYELSVGMGQLTILPKYKELTLKWNAEMPKSRNLSYEEAQTFNFGGKLYDGDKVVDEQKFVKAYYGGAKPDLLPEIGNEPIRKPGVWVETVYVLGGNYWAEPIYRTYTIDRIGVDVEFENDKINVPYDGKKHALSATATADDGTDLSEDVTYLYEGDITTGTVYLNTEAPTLPGTYNVTATYLGDETYKFASATAKLVIERETPSITLNDTVKTYTTYEQKIDPATVTLPSGMKFKDDVYYFYFSDPGCKKLLLDYPVNAGTYYVKASVAATIYHEAATSEVKTLTIEKAEPTVTVFPNKVTYDGKPHYNLFDVDFIGLDNIRIESIDYSYNYYEDEECTVPIDGYPVNAGKYYVQISTGELKNYKPALSNVSTLTIGKATPLVALSDKTVVYDGKTHENDAWIKWVNGEKYDLKDIDHTYTYYSDFMCQHPLEKAPKDVGVYYVTLTLGETDNYNEVTSWPRKLIITDATPIVTLYDLTVTYDGEVHENPATIVWVDGEEYDLDEVDHTYNYYADEALTQPLDEAPVDAGTYYVTLTIRNVPDYEEVTSDVKLLVIEKATPVVTLDPLTVTYDGQTHENDADIEWVDGEYFDLDEIGHTYNYYKDMACTQLLAEAPVNAGTYYVKLTVDELTNYESATSDAEILVIEKATPTVSLSDLTVTYDGNAHYNVPTITWVNGEHFDLSDLDYAYTYSLDPLFAEPLDEAPTDVGTYYVIFTVAETTNYTMASNLTPATLVINPAPIDSFSAELKQSEFTYSGEAVELEYTVTSNTLPPVTLIEGVDYNVTYSQDGEAVDKENLVTAGSYTVTFTGIGNYKNTVTKTVTILPRVSVIDSLGITYPQGTVIDTIPASSNGEYEITDAMIASWELLPGTYRIAVEYGDRTSNSKLIIKSEDPEYNPEKDIKKNIYTSIADDDEAIAVVADKFTNAAYEIVDKDIDIDLDSEKVDINLRVTAASQENTLKAKELLKHDARTVGKYYDMTVRKTVTNLETGMIVKSELVSDTDTPLEITMPMPFGVPKGKTLSVARLHDNNGSTEVTKFKEVASRDLLEDGTYLLDGDEIVLMSRYFSTFALSYQSSGGSSGSSNTPITYKVNLPTISEGGNVTSDKIFAYSNEKVTLTANPTDGYRLTNIQVVSMLDKDVELEDLGDGTYTFKMPNTSVTVNASFAPNKVSLECPKDETCPISQFTDSKPTAWYHDGVHYCVENGLMIGTTNTTFEPDSTLNRAMFVTAIWRLEGKPQVNLAMPYNDVPNDYYTEAVRWAAAEKLVLGTSATTFEPNKAITREEIATILYRYAQYKGVDVNAAVSDINTLDYNDIDKVSEWAAPAVHYCIAVGLIEGDGRFNINPTANATRAEFATLLMRAISIIK